MVTLRSFTVGECRNKDGSKTLGFCLGTSPPDGLIVLSLVQWRPTYPEFIMEQ